MPAEAAATTAISTSPSRCSRIRPSAAKATTCTSSCRWRFTKRRWARRSTCRRSTVTARLRSAARHAVGSAFPGARARRRRRPRDGRRGDLVVEVQLVLPKLLDERSKELLREFGRINGSDRDVRSAKLRVSDVEEDRQGVLHDQRGVRRSTTSTRRRFVCTNAKACSNRRAPKATRGCIRKRISSNSKPFCHSPEISASISPASRSS